MYLDTLQAYRQRRCFIEEKRANLLVYIKLIIVSTTLTIAGGGGVCASDLPPVGISPARIGVDSAHISTSVIANRFME